MNGKNIAVLVSGGGTNLQALIDAGIPVSLVISSKPDAYALTRAKGNGIKTAVVEWAAYKSRENSRAAFSGEILRILQESRIDLVVYAGFMIVLDEIVTRAFPGRMLNVHPALIPAFSGMGFYGIKVHEAALRAGVKLTGATVHFVNEICDGGAIILQKAVAVHDGDTPETLQKRVMLEAEHVILVEAVKLFCEDRIEIIEGRAICKS